jgi:uncharacterized protein
MSADLEQFKNQSNNLKKENRQFFDKLKLKKPKDLDDHFHSAHEDVFSEFDCLSCANCCKTTLAVLTAVKQPLQFSTKGTLNAPRNDYV